jgi:fibronectin-binding autotransporter adhesin
LRPFCYISILYFFVMKVSPTTHLRHLFTVTFVIFLLPKLPAITLTWDGNGAASGVSRQGGNWDDTAVNWRTGATNVAWDSFADPANSANFGGGGTTGVAGSVVVSNDGVVVQNISFRSANGGSFALTGGEIDLSGSITNTDAANVSIGNVISGTGSITRNLGGTLTLSGANTYQGATTISGGATVALTGTGHINGSTALNIEDGTLLLNSTATNRIQNTAPVTLGTAGGVGTLKLAGTVTETIGSLTLAAADQIIDLGAGAVTLTMASLGGGGTFKIFNYSGGAIWTAGTLDKLTVTSASLGSLASGSIQFYSDGGSTPIGSGAGFIGSELVPVPEPGTLLGAAACLVPLAAKLRRKRRQPLVA